MNPYPQSYGDDPPCGPRDPCLHNGELITDYVLDENGDGTTLWHLASCSPTPNPNPTPNPTTTATVQPVDVLPATGSTERTIFGWACIILAAGLLTLIASTTRRKPAA